MALRAGSHSWSFAVWRVHGGWSHQPNYGTALCLKEKKLGTAETQEPLTAKNLQTVSCFWFGEGFQPDWLENPHFLAAAIVGCRVLDTQWGGRSSVWSLAHLHQWKKALFVCTMEAGPSIMASGAAGGVPRGGPGENPIFNSMVKKVWNWMHGVCFVREREMSTKKRVRLAYVRGMNDGKRCVKMWKK